MSAFQAWNAVDTVADGVDPRDCAVSDWLPTDGYEGYEISRRGVVRSLDRVKTCSDGRRRPLQGQELTPWLVGWGYEAVSLAGIAAYVHVLVLTAFHEPRPAGLVARHLDGDCRNNRAENLAWGTPSRNSLDTVAHGTHAATRRTHCPRGHGLVEPNLIVAMLANGYRSCLACDRARTRVSVRSGRPELLQVVADAYYYEITTGDSAQLGELGIKRYRPQLAAAQTVTGG